MKWADIQVGHGLWIRRDDDGRIVIPRDIVREAKMQDRQKARVLFIKDAEDLEAAAGPRTKDLIKRGSVAVLLLFSDKEEGS